MSRAQVQRDALRDMREILTRFVKGSIGVGEFVPGYRRLFAPFDPPDLSVDELSAAEQSELTVLIRLMGGWFGEDEDVIPRKSEWKYGEDIEPFSWIDESAYRKVIQESLTAAGFDLGG